MGQRAYIIRGKYSVVNDEEFFKQFMHKDFNISEVWPDENAPEKIVCNIKKDTIYMSSKPSKNIEFIEKHENEERAIYLEPEDLVELEENGAIEPIEGSREITVKP
jgi:hypothetical protein